MSDTDGDAETSRAQSIGATIGAGLAWPFLVIGGVTKAIGSTFLTSLTRRLPFIGKSFWRSMVKMSTQQYQKAAGADVVNFSAEPHGIEPRAANYVEADPEEPDTRPGWKEVGGDKTWGAGAEGRDVERMGKADIIFTDRSAHETATPLQMRVAEALDLEHVDALIEGATVNQTFIETWPADPEEMQTGGDAVADGGMARRERGPITVHAEQAGLKDAVVDLSSDFRDGKGMRISARKYKHQYETTTDVEEMQKQETRGYLAGKSGYDSEKIFKIAAIALLVVLGVAVGPTLIQALFGSGGGGGGGSLIPIMLGL